MSSGRSGKGATVQLAHGGGGTLMHALINDRFRRDFANPWLDAAHDAAVLDCDARRIAFTTDSYVVRPLFFPGGDIGTLAVNGTVNDLAMSGARPRWLSAAFVIEEGFPLDDLARVTASMAACAEACGVHIVTGDTKVVDRGHGDGLYINTAGVGLIAGELVIAPGRVRDGDVLILSGDIGRHGVAVMGAREGLEFESAIESDCAPLDGPVAALLEAGLTPHCLRDLTRGGLGAALVEIAETSGLELQAARTAIPVSPAVEGACELLGLDPLFVANEGRMLIVVPHDQADATLACLREQAGCGAAALIGSCRAGASARVTLETEIGTRRRLILPSGEQLPRIC